jgi:hypothetical protein
MRIHAGPKPCLDVAQGGALQLRTVVTVSQLQKLHAVFVPAVLRIHDILGVDPDPRIHASD